MSFTHSSHSFAADLIPNPHSATGYYPTRCAYCNLHWAYLAAGQPCTHNGGAFTIVLGKKPL